MAEYMGLIEQPRFSCAIGALQSVVAIPRAGFNILVSPWYGKAIADHLKTLYGQDYYWFHSVPIGANETEKFLRGVLDFALDHNAGISKKKAESFIQHVIKELRVVTVASGANHSGLCKNYPSGAFLITVCFFIPYVDYLPVLRMSEMFIDIDSVNTCETDSHFTYPSSAFP